MKVAFLDRDGTINRDYPDHIWSQIQSPEILPGAIQGMKYLKEKGYKIIIITNQYHDFNEQLLILLEENDISILDVFYCPHSRKEQCDCCKPKNGLIKQALRKYQDINLKESFMCGDSLSDMKCAESVGLKFFCIDIGEQRINSLADLCDLI